MRSPARLFTALALLGLAATPAEAAPAWGRHAYFAQPEAQPVSSAVKSAGPLLEAFVAHRDSRRGTPTFVWGGALPSHVLPSATPEEAARAHLAAHAALWGLDAAALASVRVAAVHDTGRGGLLVAFEQAVSGVPVFHERLSVLLRRDRSLVALGGSLRADALPAPKRRVFAQGPEEALSASLGDLYGAAFSPGLFAPSATSAGLETHGGYRRWDLARPATGAVSGLRFQSPARVREVLFPLPTRLVPAHHVEVYVATRAGAAAEMRGYVISAEDGSVLYRRDLVAFDTFSYRVWAEPTGDLRPTDGPIEDFTPHPTGSPDGSVPGYVAPSLVSVDGLNGPKDPWLAPGATDTRGNNVDAYTDLKNPDGFGSGDVRGTTTSPGVFDQVYDTSKDPLETPEQSKASATQLFYVNNWLHDTWYDSGFDEAAGNAQEDNYGRGGVDGDRLRAEAQDGALAGSLNNANMGTPEDGQSPRMQMFLWSAADEKSVVTTLSATPLVSGVAEFGPTDFDLSAEVERANDASGTPSDACQALVGDLSGKIALVDRGTCTFHEKAVNSEAAGAVGMLLVNNQAGSPPDMPASNFGTVNIPVLSISQAEGNAIAASIGTGVVSATMHRKAGVRVDGTLDNLIVAHEWGHYLHHRLTFCALNQCGGQSEGWGDFLALITQLRPGDDLDGAYSDALYATRAMADHAYFGTRRMPYSVDPSVNPLTFQHIASSAPLPSGVPISDSGIDNAEVHNAGEIWASMLFEGYVELLRQTEGPSPKYTFEEARRRMQDYVVLGMKLAPSEPTFTEQRDGILAAALASDVEDALRLAQGFATRGAGSCAVSPPKESFDNEGVVESFDVSPAVGLGAVTLDDSLLSCDADGRLDAGEQGVVAFTVANAGVAEALGTTLTISTSTPGVEFPEGNTLTIDSLPALGSQTIAVPIALSAEAQGSFPIALTVLATNPVACLPVVQVATAPRANYDDLLASSSTADFESDVDVWHPLGGLADAIWQRSVQGEGPNHVYHGVDYGAVSDASIVSPPLLVSADQELTLTFRHRHSFEESPGPSGGDEHWDGAVVEVREDGASFVDLAAYGDPSYGGIIGNLADNPLADRPGYVGKNDAWPEMETVTVSLGKAFAGKTIELRFRIGTDQAASEFGWEIDDVALTGLAASPFPSIVEDTASCGEVSGAPPRAELGADRTVRSGEVVELDASGSSDPDGDPLGFAWAQLMGPEVALAPSDTMMTFIAPDVSSPTRMTFTVTVTDDDGADVDAVDVVVLPAAGATESLAAGGGCGCRVVEVGDEPSSPAHVAGAALLGLGLVAARRRRRQA